jgi:hypothetical protein
MTKIALKVAPTSVEGDCSATADTLTLGLRGESGAPKRA